MGRPLRADVGGFVYHALNRGNGRAEIFTKPGDFEAFERILAETLEHVPGMRLCGYCLMPNHWHLLLWPRRDGELSDFMHWLTLTHTQRWHAHYENVGAGHLYQGRFKSFPIEADEHYLTVLRYAERNALRANLVTRAEAWRWGSLWRRVHRESAAAVSPLNLHAGPVPLPPSWAKEVNRPQTEAELAALRRSVTRGQPYGSTGWVERTASKLGLTSTLRSRGRPKKASKAAEEAEKGS